MKHYPYNAIHFPKKTVVQNNRFVQVPDEPREVIVLARDRDRQYALVCRPGCYPYVAENRELRQIPKSTPKTHPPT